MNLLELQATRAAHRAELDSFGVEELLVFGSVARGDSRPDSDVDLLVRFARPTGFLTLIRLRDFLVSVLGRPVDLVTEGGLRPWMRPGVLALAVRAA